VGVGFDGENCLRAVIENSVTNLQVLRNEGFPATNEVKEFHNINNDNAYNIYELICF
jgi:hypothetical protein